MFRMFESNHYHIIIIQPPSLHTRTLVCMIYRMLYGPATTAPTIIMRAMFTNTQYIVRISDINKALCCALYMCVNVNRHMCEQTCFIILPPETIKTFSGYNLWLNCN